MLTVLAHGGQITGDEIAVIGLGAVVLLGVLGTAVRRAAAAADSRSGNPREVADDSTQDDTPPPRGTARRG